MTSGDGGPATLREVAERAGVSMATVSRVLADNYPVAQRTRQRVLRAIRELDYVANTHARALRGRGTPTVAFVLNDVRGASFAQVAHGVEEEAARRGRICLICTTQGDPERELSVVRTMREQGAGAVILIGGVVDDAAYREQMTAIAHSLDASGSRLVLCGRPPLGEGVPATVVEYDNEGGAYAVVSRLLAQGHRRILFLGADRAGTTTSAGRVAGYRRALADFDAPSEPGLIQEADFNRADAYENLRRRLAAGRDFTAVFAVTDVVAAGALAALTDAGLDVPGDVSLVGYDDIDLATDLRPRLTTVHVPYAELGRTAVRLALGLREGESSSAEQYALLGTHVVVRDSTAPPAAPPRRPRPRRSAGS
ncbi:LacI family DNA-binding transcriptional regulator [Streptomyces millisiae]|uniref:LacI family DNA-binding transcriptional regulator n=1 Tax=Streptomyces millisiae TaxID=3075542 RepID=A0ABU2LUV5_9ACTN|nr:LacI family DNA-binding transcriptional regulator [Streptomyces sp. DSM 44918]MDT0321359.1 LacI family DNA-binding transcriptional regulator [Streptomyces sp. DSM 44918]